MWRSKKWIIPIAALALIFAIWLAVPALVDLNTYRGRIARQLKDRWGRSVTLGTLSLSLFPGVSIEVAGAVIRDDPQFSSGEFITARSVRLSLGLWSLLTGDPQVRSLELTEPVVVLIKGERGTWNWSTLKPLQAPEPGAELAPIDIIVRDGRFTLINRHQSPPTERTYTGVNINLKDFSPRSASEFLVTMTMPGQAAGKLQMEGTIGPLNAADLTQTPLKTKVKMQQVDLAALEALLGQPSSRKGWITLDVQADGRLTESLKVNGQITAEKLRLAENTAPADVPLQATFAIQAIAQGHSAYRINIASGQLRLGETEVHITGQVSQLPANPILDLRLQGRDVLIGGLLESAYAFGFGLAKGTSVSGRATLDVRASGPPKAVALDGLAEIRDLTFRLPQLRQTIRVSPFTLTFDPTAITASPLSTTLGERTTVNITSLSLRNYRQQPRAYLSVVTHNAQVGDLITIAESLGVRPGFSGTGILNLQAALQSDLDVTTGMITITGQGALQDARLQIPQLAQPVGIAAADLKFTGDSLRAENLRARLATSRITGWVQIKDFARPQVRFELQLDQLIVSELQQLLVAHDAAQTPAPVGRQAGLLPPVLAQRKPSTPGPTDIRVEGRLASRRVIFDNLTASDVQSTVALRDQVLNLDPLSFNFYGGRYEGRVRIDLTGSEPNVVLGGRFAGVDVNQFLSAASSLKGVVYGRAGGTLDLRGRGRQFDSVTKSLTGQGRLSVTDGKITSFDLEQQIALIGKLTGMPAGGAGTAFRQLDTTLRFTEGKMVTEDLLLEMGQITVTGNGGLRLGDPVTTDYDLLAQLSPALTKRLLGGGNVFGNFFLQGQWLVVPLKMSGPLTHPRFSLNTELLRRRMTDRFRQRPGEVVKDIFDMFKRKDTKPKKPTPKP